jgi:hypothetical protein
MAVAVNFDATSWNGTGWSALTTIDSASFDYNAVSCTSPTFCMAADSAGNVESYDGSTWSSPTPADATAANLTWVSCTSPSFCMAVDGTGNALIYSTIAATLTLSGTPVTSTSGNAYTVSLKVPTGDSSPTGSVTITDSATGTCSTTPTWSGTIDSPAGYDTYTDGCSIATPESSGETVSAVYNGADYTVATSPSLDIATAPVAPSPVVQVALTLTSTSGTVGTALTLTSSGGSGTGVVTYAVANGTATGCAISGSSLSATAAGTCIVTATKAADTTYESVSSTATTVTFAAPTTTTTTPPAPVSFYAAWVHGTPLVGRTVTVMIGGSGFYGQPRITSTEVGTRAVVSHDSGKLLTVRVTVRAGSRKGEHTFTIRLANGKSCRVNYLVK